MTEGQPNGSAGQCPRGSPRRCVTSQRRKAKVRGHRSCHIARRRTFPLSICPIIWRGTLVQKVLRRIYGKPHDLRSPTTPAPPPTCSPRSTTTQRRVLRRHPKRRMAAPRHERQRSKPLLQATSPLLQANKPTVCRCFAIPHFLIDPERLAYDTPFLRAKNSLIGEDP